MFHACLLLMDEAHSCPHVHWVTGLNWSGIYCKISNTSHTKSPNLIVPRLVLQLSLANPMKPGREWRCSWISPDNNFFAYWCASYIRDSTAHCEMIDDWNQDKRFRWWCWKKQLIVKSIHWLISAWCIISVIQAFWGGSGTKIQGFDI